MTEAAAAGGVHVPAKTGATSVNQQSSAPQSHRLVSYQCTLIEIVKVHMSKETKPATVEEVREEIKDKVFVNHHGRRKSRKVANSRSSGGQGNQERYEYEHRKEMMFTVTKQCLSILLECPWGQVQLSREARHKQEQMMKSKNSSAEKKASQPFPL
jgi:hypothetical protein